jgi:hypothetical protein
MCNRENQTCLLQGRPHGIFVLWYTAYTELNLVSQGLPQQLARVIFPQKILSQETLFKRCLVHRYISGYMLMTTKRSDTLGRSCKTINTLGCM